MLEDTAHRSYPLPRRPWVISMQWHDLLFMHWPMRPETLLPYIPPGLILDTYDGMAWLSVVPFRMTGIRVRSMPALPLLSQFPEINVRTYVTLEGKPGVWFLTLDADNPVAVQVARAIYHVNYYDAHLSSKNEGETVRYRSVRMDNAAAPAQFQARYSPAGPSYQASKGSIDAWLTERYCLYAANKRGMIWRGDIHHAPWSLQPASAEIETNTMVSALGLRLPDTPPLMHFARFLDTIFWMPERVIAAKQFLSAYAHGHSS